MRSIVLAVSASLLLTVVAPATTEAAIASKKYVFKPDVTLELNADVGEGVRIVSVKFTIPPKVEGSNHRLGGSARVDVAVANSGENKQKVGIAVALFAENGSLVGVASGGSTLMSIRPNRLTLYSLVFDHVNYEASEATQFQITVETK